MGRWEDEEQSHKNWIADIAQAKRNVREFLFEVENSNIDPTIVILEGSQKQTASVKNLHAAILDYQDQVNVGSIRQYCSDMWEQELYTAQYGGITEKISLSKLGDWSLRYETFERSVNDPVGGSNTESVQYRLWIPPAAARACYSQINDILEEVNLSLELPEQSIDIMEHEPL